MSALNRSQREKVANFQGVTGAPAKLAAEFLKRCSWSLDQAVDTFFTEGHSFTPSGGSASCDSRKLDAFFKNYKAADEDSIQPDGVKALCDDLQIDCLDPVTLALSYYCRAQQMGTFTREEFIGGMQRLGCDEVGKLRSKVEDLRAMLKDRAQCKEIYAFTFQFALDQGQKCLPVEMCVEFWKLLLKDHFVLLDKWIAFVEARCKNAISKDTWMMLYDLATQVKPDLSDYDVNGAWPVLLDEFVEQVKDNQL
jgi:DCN1-like protein 1/2